MRIVNQLVLLSISLVFFISCGCSDKKLSEDPTDMDMETDEQIKPNIIFLLTDDQRHDLLGANGNDIVQTPNLDALAKKGTNFKNHYVTTSICSVSRASILSGQYGRRHNLWGFGSGFSEASFDQTYPMVLQRNGYHVGFVGKYGVGPIGMPERKHDFWRGFANQGTYRHQDEDGNPIHLTKKLGNQMIEFLDSLPKEKPFCLSVSFKSPHVQDGAPAIPEQIFPTDPAYDAEYESVIWEKPELFDPAYFDHFPAPAFGQDNEARKRFRARFGTEANYDGSLEGYYRLVHGVDVQIGRLVQALEEKGLDQNTVIIFSSDNGFYLGEYGFAGKWYGSQPSIKTPLFIYDPRRQAGQEVSALSLNIDIAPTILGIAEVAAPANYQGQNLMKVVEGKTDYLRGAFFYEHLWPITPGYPIPSTEGVVKEDIKYMRYFNGLDINDVVFEELYDLTSDPKEKINLAQDSRYQKDKAQMISMIKGYRETLK